MCRTNLLFGRANDCSSQLSSDRHRIHVLYRCTVRRRTIMIMIMLMARMWFDYIISLIIWARVNIDKIFPGMTNLVLDFFIHKWVGHKDFEISQAFHDLDDVKLWVNSFLAFLIKLQELVPFLKATSWTADDPGEVSLDPVWILYINVPMLCYFLFYLSWCLLRDEVLVQKPNPASIGCAEHLLISCSCIEQLLDSSHVEAMLRNWEKEEPKCEHDHLCHTS